MTLNYSLIPQSSLYQSRSNTLQLNMNLSNLILNLLKNPWYKIANNRCNYWEKNKSNKLKRERESRKRESKNNSKKEFLMKPNEGSLSKNKQKEKWNNAQKEFNKQSQIKLL